MASQVICSQLNAGRHAFEALCAQLNAERLASQALRDQFDEERFASEALCNELEVRRLALLDFLHHEAAPERVERATQAIKDSRGSRAGYAKGSCPQDEKPAASGRDEETRHDGFPALPATLNHRPRMSINT